MLHFYCLEGVGTVDQSVSDVSSWWQAVRYLLSESILIGQSLVMAIVCRSVAMEIMTAAQKVKVRNHLKKMFEFIQEFFYSREF